MKNQGIAINLVIILTGLIITGIGLYRQVPLQINSMFFKQHGPIWITALLLSIYLATTHGAQALQAAGNATLRASAGFAPTMAGFFIVMGLMGVVVNYNRQTIIRFMTTHGYYGSLLSSLVLASPTAIAPEMKNLWQSTPAIRPVLIHLFNTCSLLSVPLFYIRTLGMDPGMQWRLYLSSACMCVLQIPILLLASAFGFFE